MAHEDGESPYNVPELSSKIVHSPVHTPGDASKPVTESIKQNPTAQYDRLFTPMHGSSHGRRRDYPSSSICVDLNGSMETGFCSNLAQVEEPKGEKLQAMASRGLRLPPLNRTSKPRMAMVKDRSLQVKQKLPKIGTTDAEICRMPDGT